MQGVTGGGFPGGPIAAAAGILGDVTGPEAIGPGEVPIGPGVIGAVAPKIPGLANGGEAGPPNG